MNTEPISLDGLRMNAVETDPNGVIGVETIFKFRQTGSRVYAEYAGGKIDQGYLVGVVDGAAFEFRYCQLEVDGSLNGGVSQCELARGEDSLIQIIEHFEWESRPGKGRNVFQELKSG